MAARVFIVGLALTAWGLGTARAQNLAPRAPIPLAGPVAGAGGAPSVTISTRTTLVAWANVQGSTGEVWSTAASGRAVDWRPPVRVDRDASGATKVTQSDSCHTVGVHHYVFWIDGRSGAGFDDVYFNVSSNEGVSFAALDQAIPDGFAGLGEVRSFRAVCTNGPTGHRLHVAMRVAPSQSIDDELWYTRSTNGGVSWSAPIHIAGDASAGHDVGQFALAAVGDSVHLVWEDDSANGVGRYSVHYAKSANVGATFGAAVPLDPTDALDLGSSQAPGEYGLRIGVEGATVAVAWLEERDDPSNEEVRLAVSTNGGATFAPDERISSADPTQVDVDYIDLWLGQGTLLVAYTDDRTGPPGIDQLYLWRRPVAGGPSTEVVLSDARGATFPRLCGTGTQTSLCWLTDDSVYDSMCLLLSENVGATWSPVCTLYDAGTALDADHIDMAYAPDYDNFVVAHAADSGSAGENRPWISGVRAPSLAAIGFAPQAPTFHFEGRRLVEGDAVLLVVVISATSGSGALLLPDLRDLGTTYDALTSAGITLLPVLMGAIQPDGTAATPITANGLPLGFTFKAVGIAIGPSAGTVRITDVVDVTVN